MKILHAPVEVANQSSLSVKGLRSNGYYADSMVFESNKFNYSNEINLGLNNTKNIALKLIKKFCFFLKAIVKYDIFHFHFGRSLLPHNIDLFILRLLKKKVVMQFHGTDIRKKSVIEKSNKFYTFCSPDSDTKSCVKQKRISKHVNTAIVADFELYEHVDKTFKQVHIVPHRIDLERFEPQYPSMDKEVPLIVHAPSKRGGKGTDIVINVISKLQQRHKIDFMLVENKSNKEAIEIYKKADIVIDQILVGTYGVFAVETMALGKPVICYIREDLRDKFLEKPPIISANPENLYEAVENLILKPSLRNEIGLRSREYVERVHDTKIVAEKLIEIYQQT